MTYCYKCGNLLVGEAKFCPKCGAPVEAVSVPSVLVPEHAMASGPKVALWGERFVAWLIDSVLVGVFVGILGMLTWFVWQPFSFMPGWFPLFNFGSGGIIYFLYWTLMDGVYGQSVGKMIMHLRVTKLNGSPVGISDAALESVGKAFFLLLDLLIGYALYPRRRQRIFNYLSETIVIHQ